MTVSARSAPLAFAGIDDVAASIRARGGRLSAARRLLLEALFDAEGPVAAELIASRLARDGHDLDIASIYRNLESLEALGAVRHVHLGHGPGLYALVGRGEREYLACERCNRVISVEPEALDAVRRAVKSRFGFEARFTHFPITGLCPECAALPDDERLEQGELHIGDEREHSHGDRIHSHPHAHRNGIEDEHEHEHDE